MLRYCLWREKGGVPKLVAFKLLTYFQMCLLAYLKKKKKF